jgi:hypothetical protein
VSTGAQRSKRRLVEVGERRQHGMAPARGGIAAGQARKSTPAGDLKAPFAVAESRPR